MGKVRVFSHHVRWTDQEIGVLRYIYADADLDALQGAFPSRPLRTIQSKAAALGLRRQKMRQRTADEVRAAKREDMARRHALDPAAHREKQRAWVDENRAHVRIKVRQYHRRRFFWAKSCRLRRESAHAATHVQLAQMWKLQRGRCALTGQRLNRANAELDHILPKARGGNGSIENLRWVTKQANRAKRDLTDAEFFSLCSSVMRWIGMRIDLMRGAA